jgi:Icc-related predicted phosphoesterase
MRIVLISDTHGLHDGLTVPPGDVLIFPGDAGRRGTLEELRAFNDFLGGLPHPQKIFVAGNRDYFFERQPEESRRMLTNAVYLQDEEISIDGVRIYGSPWQPPFINTAFNLPRGGPLRDKWARIPAGIDILVTHTPPYGIGDRTSRGESVGCEELRAAVRRIKPKVHVFGHVHEGYGKYHEDGILYINASVTNAAMQLAYEPIVYNFQKG